MSTLANIGAFTPANKTAALVTGAGPGDAREDTRSEQHRNLALIAQKLSAAIRAATDPVIRERYVAQYQRVTAALAVLNKTQAKHPRLRDTFVEAARDLLPKALFTTLMNEARHRCEQITAAKEAEAVSHK